MEHQSAVAAAGAGDGRDKQNGQGAGPGGGNGGYNNNNNNNNDPVPQPCPRCNSAKTKFCYFNNYSLSQPRFFCRECRRYWTQGGSLRNVPVGGGCRKSKRPRRLSVEDIASTSHQLPLLPLQLPLQGQPLPPLPQPAVPAAAGNGNNNNMLFGRQGNRAGLFVSAALAAIHELRLQHQFRFGTNISYLQGFDMPNLPPSPSQVLRNVYTESEATATPTEWTLGAETGVPALPSLSENNNDDVINNVVNAVNNDGDDSNNNTEWSDFMGTNGLDEP